MPIHQSQITGQNSGAGKTPSKTTDEVRTVDKYGEEKERRRKYMELFPKGSGESTKWENMEALYASIRS